MRYTQLNGIWTKSFDSTDLAVTPGVTTVGAQDFVYDLDFKGLRRWQLQVSYTLGAGAALSISYQGLLYDGSTAMGNSQGVALGAGSRVNLWWDGSQAPAFGFYDVFGVGNGNLNTGGSGQPFALEKLRFRITRTAGATESTLGVVNLFARS